MITVSSSGSTISFLLLFFLNSLSTLAQTSAEQPQNPDPKPQKGWYLTLQSGPARSYNVLRAEQQMPSNLKPINRVGVSFGAELEYRWDEKWSVTASVRSANIKRGFKYSYQYVDTVTLQLAGSSTTSFLQTSPAHFTLAVFRHTRPFWNDRFSASFGLGAAGIIVRDLWSSGEVVSSAEPGNSFYGAFADTEATSFGYSITAQMALNYHLNQRDGFSLRLLHYQGLRTLYTLTSEDFQYHGQQFRAQLRTYGTYSALQLGYTRKLGRSARPNRVRWLPEPAQLDRTEFYLGFEIGPKTDYFRHTENGPYMRDRPLLNGMWGILAGVTWKERHQLESGLSRNYTSETVYLELPHDIEIGRYSSGSGYDCWQIPLRYRYRLPLVRHKLYLVPAAGAVFMAGIPTQSTSGGWGTVTFPSGTSGDTTFYSTVSYSHGSSYIRKRNVALEAGLGLEMRLLKRASVRFSARYQHGLATVSRTNVEYHPVDEGPYQGTITNRGTMMQYQLGLSMPLYRLPAKATAEPLPVE